MLMACNRRCILVDYENIQPVDFPVLEDPHVSVIIFVGSKQSTISFDMASRLQPLGKNVSYVKVSRQGSNALDMHIAYYIGRIAKTFPQTRFEIISKDKGFDALICHLKQEKIFAARRESISEPVSQIDADLKIELEVGQSSDAQLEQNLFPKGLSERLQLVVSRLLKTPNSRPGTEPALFNVINSIFQKTVPKEEIHGLIRQMKQRRWVAINGKKVTYSLSKPEK